MRQTLFRIIPDFWQLDWAGNRSVVGVGYLLIALATYAVVTACWNHRQGRRAEPAGLSWTALGVLGGVLIIVPNSMPGGVPVYGYGFMMFLGFLAAGKNAEGRAISAGLNRELVWDMSLWIFLSGVAGSRTFYLIQYRERVFNGLDAGQALKAAINLSDGGLVLYGGVILGTVTYLVLCRVRKVSPLVMGDVAMPSVFIGLAFGRTGCFLNGCCFGDRCELPWAVQFPSGSVPFSVLVARGFQDPAAPFSIPLHPTQIYSVINASLLAVLTAVYFRYRDRPGSVLAVGFTLYPLTRIVIELLRGDEMGQFGTGLTISQWVSLMLSALSLAFLIYLFQQVRQTSENS